MAVDLGGQGLSIGSLISSNSVLLDLTVDHSLGQDPDVLNIVVEACIVGVAGGNNKVLAGVVGSTGLDVDIIQNAILVGINIEESSAADVGNVVLANILLVAVTGRIGSVSDLDGEDGVVIDRQPLVGAGCNLQGGSLVVDVAIGNITNSILAFEVHSAGGESLNAVQSIALVDAVDEEGLGSNVSIGIVELIIGGTENLTAVDGGSLDGIPVKGIIIVTVDCVDGSSGHFAGSSVDQSSGSGARGTEVPNHILEDSIGVGAGDLSGADHVAIAVKEPSVVGERSVLRLVEVVGVGVVVVCTADNVLLGIRGVQHRQRQSWKRR